MSLQDYIRAVIKDFEQLLQEFPEQSEELLRAARQRFGEDDQRYSLLAYYFDSCKKGIPPDEESEGERPNDPTHILGKEGNHP
ncbi:MAG: hypothetical protein EHM87_25545 [Burkholderiales bacterium]|nr:MAG: hypothetical protein EHM87_25545 [Burkholderiales bacterium]